MGITVITEERFQNKGGIIEIFYNWLYHAVEGKGIIKICSRVEDEQVVIDIKDNSKGIPAKNLKTIFDPGFTTKSVGVKTGLGLSISYNIIQKHKGTIKVSSEAGKGSIFRIILPLNLEKNRTLQRIKHLKLDCQKIKLFYSYLFISYFKLI